VFGDAVHHWLGRLNPLVTRRLAFGLASALVEPLVALGRLEADVGVLLLDLLDDRVGRRFVEVLPYRRLGERSDTLVLKAVLNLRGREVVEMVPLEGERDTAVSGRHGG